MTESAGLPCCSEDRKRRSACLVRAEECRTGDPISHTGTVTTGSMGSSDNSTSQLVQAMAGFVGGSGAADTSNTAPIGADTSQ